MFNALDWVFIAVLLLGAVAGFKKGLINSVGGLAAILLGVYAAVSYWQKVIDYLQESYNLISICAESIEKHFPVPVFDMTEGMVPLLFKNTLYAYQNISYHLASLLISATVFILLMVVTASLVSALFKVISIPFDWGFLGLVNRLGGTVFELSKQLLILTLAVGLLAPILRTAAQAGLTGAITLTGYLNGSLLLHFFENLFQVGGSIMGLHS